MSAPPVEVSDGLNRYYAERPPARFWRNTGRRVECTLCFRRCRLDKGETGWCGIRQNVNGVLTLTEPFTLSTAYVHTRLHPWHRAGAPVAYFGKIRCTFGCSFCSSTRIVHAPDKLAWIYDVKQHVMPTSDTAYYRGMLHPEGAITFAEMRGVDQITFGANEPMLDFEWTFEVARRAKAAEIITSVDTNGATNPKAIEAISPFIDHAHLGIKGSADPDFYAKHVRAEGAVPHVLKGIETWRAQPGTTLAISDTIAPYHWQDDETFESSAKRLYRWIAETIGKLTVVQIRSMARMTWPPDTLGELHFLTPKADGWSGEERQLARVRRAVTLAREAGLRYVTKDLEPFHCHNCGLRLRWDAAPEHICKGCGTWVPVRTWAGERA